jgi:hypothetical protein
MFSLILLLLSPSARAADLSPITVISAAEQNCVTVDSLRFEAEQFAALSSWQDNFDQSKISRAQVTILKKDRARAEELRKSGTITIEKFVIADFLYKLELSKVAEREASMDLNRAEVAVAALSLLHECRAKGVDADRIAAARLEAEKKRAAVLKIKLAIVEEEVVITKLKEKGGDYLKEKNVVNNAELERRALATANVELRAAALRNQISLSERAIASMEKALSLR